MSAPTSLHDGDFAGSQIGPDELGAAEVSVVELQWALRHARCRSGQRPTGSEDNSRARVRAGDFCPLGPGDASPGLAEESRTLEAPLACAAIDRDWVVVLAAHSGAGASTIALGLLDAMAAAGRRPTLVETGPASRSGLVAAAETELGRDLSGLWLRGRRGGASLLRPASELAAPAWPAEITDPTSQPTSAGSGSTVVDLGLATERTLGRLGAATRTVVVARATIPGLRQAEQLLSHLNPSHPVLLVTLGGSARSGPARASEGRRIHQLRECGAVQSAPLDRRLGVRGLSSDPLPKSVIGVCSRVLALLDKPPDPTPTGRGNGHHGDHGKDAA